MPTYPKLRIPQTNRVKLFRAIDDHFRNDPTIKAVVRTFQSWQGDPSDKTPDSFAQSPGVRLSMFGGPQQFWASTTKLGTLVVVVELSVSGYCIDDLDNLWGLFERSCYPSDPATALAFQAKLRTAGAHTGLITFSAPAFDRTPGTGCLCGTGQFAIDYRFDTHPLSPGI